jgi:hypothetical protein
MHALSRILELLFCLTNCVACIFSDIKVTNRIEKMQGNMQYEE